MTLSAGWFTFIQIDHPIQSLNVQLPNTNTKVQKYRNTKNLNYTKTKLQKYRITKIQNYKKLKRYIKLQLYKNTTRPNNPITQCTTTKYKYKCKSIFNTNTKV